MRRDDSIFCTLLESAAEGIIVVDVTGRIVLVNGTAEKLFGYRQEELLGQLVETLLPESRRAVHQRYRAEYLVHPHNRSMGIGLELVGRRKDNSEFPVEIALSTAGEGGDMLVMASVSDITRRKRREETKARVLEARVRELEGTLHTLEELGGPQKAAVTERMMGILPLREAAAEIFDELAENYGRIMDEALERKVFKIKENFSETLAELGGRLGFLKATPRDLVDLHSKVLFEKSRGGSANRIRSYLDEGHFLLVELIGHLASYYRNRAFPEVKSGAKPSPTRPGKGAKDGR